VLLVLGAFGAPAAALADEPALAALAPADVAPVCFDVASVVLWALLGAAGSDCDAEFCEAGSALLHEPVQIPQSRTQTIDSSILISIA
jgi:hypothetical protein